MLNYRTLTNDTYTTLRYQMLLNVEEAGDPKEAAYLDSKGIPTIGIGFNLRTESVREAVLSAFGFNVLAAPGTLEWQYLEEIKTIVNASYTDKETLRTRLDEVMSRRFTDSGIPAANRTHADFQFVDEGEIRGVFDALIGDYEDKVDAWFSGIPVTAQERVALVSLAWNNAGKLLGPALKQAIIDGNRAAAWYEIRYNSNGDHLGGIAKRRYYESELFGLYDSGDSTSDPDEAASVYRMYTAHRDKILQYEATYGNQITAATNDYHLTGTGHEVHTLRDELSSAATVLMGQYVKDEYGVPRSFDPLNIQVASDKATTLTGEDTTASTGSNADLLIGRDGDADTLVGRGGNDLLIGLGGDDTLYGGEKSLVQADIQADVLNGGAGYDIYHAGGDDTIHDSDGKGRAFFLGAKLTGGTRKDSDSAGQYQGDGGIYTLSGGHLTFTKGGLTLNIEDFDNRELGIYLDKEETPDDPDRSPAPPDYNPNNAVRRYDPLVLDLNGNGQIDAIGSANSTVYFDFNGDGISERAGWIAPGDGILALDTNGNGAIDDLSELFGSNQQDGFTELAGHDSNLDGVIDAQDDDFPRLLVWQDASADGIAQNGELQTLEALGITGIDLATIPANTSVADNLIIATGSFTLNGETRLAADIELAVNFTLTDSNPNRPLGQAPELDPEVYDLPWLRGYGNVKSTNIAFQEDLGLRAAATDLCSRNWIDILKNFDQFMAQWTGLDAAHQAHGVSRTTFTIEDKAWMLENLTGQDVHRSIIEENDFGATSPGANRVWNTFYIDSQWNSFVQREAISFTIQAGSREWLQGADYSLNLDRFIVIDSVRLRESLLSHLNTITDRDEAVFAAMVIARLGQDGIILDTESIEQGLATTPYSTMFNAVLDDTGETIDTGNGRVALGMSSSDWLNGGIGDDLLDGGAGNDSLVGMAGQENRWRIAA